MTIVKTHKVGNFITVTIPKELGIESGQEFIIEKGRQNVIFLVLRLDNPFDGISDLRMTDEFENMRLSENEW